MDAEKGNICFSGNDGLWRYDGKTFINITPKPFGYFCEDKNGNIWTSSADAKGNGLLLRYEAKSLYDEKPTVTKIEPNVGMLFGILEDDKGYIWFGGVGGVYRYDGNIVSAFKSSVK